MYIYFNNFQVENMIIIRIKTHDVLNTSSSDDWQWETEC